VQEMLRLERIFEAEGILGELEAYNPLIPDGSNLKATMMIAFEDPDERRTKLATLADIENRVWIQVDAMAKIFAISDEDLEREENGKTAAVHFLRFELDSAMREALKQGAALTVGVNHPSYRASIAVEADLRRSLAGDLA
jgi:hypothetical protein